MAFAQASASSGAAQGLVIEVLQAAQSSKHPDLQELGALLMRAYLAGLAEAVKTGGRFWVQPGVLLALLHSGSTASELTNLDSYWVVNCCSWQIQQSCGKTDTAAKSHEAGFAPVSRQAASLFPLRSFFVPI